MPQEGSPDLALGLVYLVVAFLILAVVVWFTHKLWHRRKQPKVKWPPRRSQQIPTIKKENRKCHLTYK